MEVIAAVSSVVAIIQISDRIIHLCKFYIETAQDASSDLRVILIELSMLKMIFENLDFLKASNNGVSKIIDSLSMKDGIIEECYGSITQLEKLFPENHVKSGHKKQKLKSTFAVLAWPLKEKKARKLLDEIMHYKTTITFALTAESVQDIKDIKTKTARLHEMLTESQRQDIYKWLQHTDPSSLHHRAQKQYVSGTGEWMLRCPEWKDWIEAKSRCLWIHGIPGAGKTVLMSYLFNRIKQHCGFPTKEKLAYISYYCYFGRDQDEAAPFLRWLLNQLCRKAESIPAHVYEMYKRGGEPSLVELLNALAEVLEKFELVYVTIDAIDESMPRQDLLKVLRDFITDSRFEKLQVLASSREYIDIERVMEQFSVAVSMANPFVEEDIKLCVHSMLQSNSKFKRWTRELLEEVEKAVSKGARGMFRWAVCQIDYIQRLKWTSENIKKALKNLPKTLEETYDRIFLALPEEDRIFVHHILQWIRYQNELHYGAGIPCNILLQAAAKTTATLTSDLIERLYDSDTLRELCGCLITVSLANWYFESGLDYKVAIVSFAHYTVREYIDSSQIKERSAVYFDRYPENLVLNPLETVLSEALNIEEKSLWDNAYEPHGQELVISAMCENFNSYSIEAGLLSLKRWPSEIFQDKRLCDIVISLLDPARHNFEILCDVARQIEYATDILSEKGWQEEHCFWGLEWAKTSMDVEAVHLMNLILLSTGSGKFDILIRKFLEGRNTSIIFQSPLRFELNTLAPGEDGSKLWEFNGSVIEITAQYGGYEESPFMLLLDYRDGPFAASKLLSLSIQHHDHDDCITEGSCFLETLLECGADPNSTEFQVTPLQTAVSTWDLEAVTILLKAQPDPNYTGNKNGIIWNEGQWMSRLNYLRNASPLYICRNLDRTVIWKDLKDRRRKDRGLIEAALLARGAVEILGE